jgi:hypothetical protein
MKRIITRLAVLATVPALAGLTFVGLPAVAANAASSCNISHPNISLHADPQYQGYSVSCAGANWAAWKIVAADGYDHGGVIYPDAMSTDYYADSFDVGGHLGKYYLRPDGAYDSNSNPIPQATETFYIKLSSHAYAHGYRSGNWVYVWAYVSRYNPAANYGSGGYTKSTNRKVTFWDWYSGAWHNAGYKYTGSNGYTPAFKIWAPTHRSFKVHAEQTYTRWGAWSSSIYR